MTTISVILSTFKIKIEEAVALVPSMMAEEKLKAVQFWNIISERLQEIVNNSAADISALAFEMEKQQDTIKPGLDQPPHDLPLPDATSLPGLAQPELSPPQPPPALPLQDNHLDSHHPADPAQLYQLDPKTESAAGCDTDDHLTYACPPQTGSRTTVGEQLNSPEQLPAEPVPPAAPPPPPPSELRGLLTATEGFGADVSKTESYHKPLVGVAAKRMRISGSSAKCNSRPFDSDQENGTGGDKLNKTDANVRRQPPRSKRRQKNFALTAADSEDSGSGGTPLVLVAAQPKLEKLGSCTATALNNHNHLSEQPLPSQQPTTGEYGELDDDVTAHVDENGEANIILTDTKSLRGTQEAIDCFLEDDDDDSELCEIDEEEELDEPEESPTLDENGHYVCFYCKKVFETLSNYSSHKYVHTKPYACTECLSRFSTKGNLIVHLRRHTGEKPFTCFQCQAKFSTKGNLKRHVKTHSGERPWQCPQCDGRFTEKKSLKVHLRRHTGEKPYKCTICGKSFAQTGILQTHLAMHNDEKEHLCEHCGKSFRQKSQLRLHMMRHAGVRKYQCHQCPSRFLTKGDLERHNRIHTGERPFVCDLCGKTFTRQQSLNEHTNRHYGLKPYHCKYCSKGFAEMSACYKHIKQHERGGSGGGGTTEAGGDADITGDDLSGTLPSPTQPDQISGAESGGGVDGQHHHHQEEDRISITCDSQKYTVLVRTDQALDVGSEISVVHHHNHHQVHDMVEDELDSDEPEIVDEDGNLGDFTAINLLANASSFQPTF